MISANELKQISWCSTGQEAAVASESAAMAPATENKASGKKSKLASKEEN